MAMKDRQQKVGQVTPSVPQRNVTSSYGFLVRLSQRMGTIATRSFVDVRGLFSRDGLTSSTERLLSGVNRLRSQQSAEEASSDTTNTSHQARADEDEMVATQRSFETIINQSHEILAQANTVFPMTLFPDTVIVDRTKISFIRRDFFWASDTMTFRIEDVLNAEVSVGPLFGSLTIASRVMSTTDHFRINYFWRKDATYLKEIIQGYIIARHNNIDTTHLTKEQLIRTLSELGGHG
ncbi:MAG: hypothetical protein WAS27_02930 [Candidatus Saccharimonadales bacterium]